jgi:hypothetical protein
MKLSRKGSWYLYKRRFVVITMITVVMVVKVIKVIKSFRSWSGAPWRPVPDHVIRLTFLRGKVPQHSVPLAGTQPSTKKIEEELVAILREY